MLTRKLSWQVWSEHKYEDFPDRVVTFLKFLKTNWTFCVAILAPLVLIAIPANWEGHNGKEPYGAYTILLMSIYFMTECIPLPATALMPILFFPLFGIAPTDKIASAYLQDAILFLFGGCIIALSFEYSNLHTRIALKVIMLIGAKISQLMLGLMLTTMFLSMWMNNTSTTAMMVPIVGAILDELRTKMLETSAKPTNGHIENGVHSEKTGGSAQSSIEKKIRSLKIMFLLATAYSSNIGGTGVITGSGTNVIVLDLVRKDADEELASEACRQKLQISFLDWMIFNVPPMIVSTLMCWAYLQIHFLGLPKFLRFWAKESKEEVEESERMNKTLEKSVKKAMKEQYEALGPIRFNELGILALFILMVILWIFKDPQIIPGWDSLSIFERTASGKSIIKECTPTLLVCVLMFIIPGKAEYYQNFWNGGLGEGMKDPLLSFDFILRKFPWGIFILLGGGSAMALGAKESGLNKAIEEFLETNETLQALSSSMILLVVLFMIAALTSVSSNTATAAIVVPVLLGMAYVKNIHPLYLVYPASTVCSYAFVLPVSTPPNAIVYSSTDLKLGEMIKPGLIVNVISIIILFISTHTVGWWVFNFGGYQNECGAMAHLGGNPNPQIKKILIWSCMLGTFYILLLIMSGPSSTIGDTAVSIKAPEEISTCAKVRIIIAETWRCFILLLTPILLLVVFKWQPDRVYEKAPFAFYLLLLMAVFWISECLPLGITSLIPVVLIPLFGILDSEAVCGEYFKHTILFLFGGCVVALAFEYSNLHTRIAFYVMRYLGAQASVLLFGMMMTCMALSCWMNNTSTTAMMVPVIDSILQEYRLKLIPEEGPEALAKKFGDIGKVETHNASPSTTTASNQVAPAGVDTQAIATGESTEGENRDSAAKSDAEQGKTEGPGENKDAAVVVDITPETAPEDENLPPSESAVAYWENFIQEQKKYIRNLEIMFMMGVAVSSNIGGTGVITGTATNLIAVEELRKQGKELAKQSIFVKNLPECLSEVKLYWALDFARWSVLNIFPMLVNTVLSWAFLALYFQGPPSCVIEWWKRTVLKQVPTPLDKLKRKEKYEVYHNIKKAIRVKCDQLGRLTLHEFLVFSLFVSIVFLWIFRNPMFLRNLDSSSLYRRHDDGLSNSTIHLIHPKCEGRQPRLKVISSWGWARFFGDKCDESYIHDYVSTVLVCFLLFVVPKDPIYYKNIFKGGLGAGFDDPLLPFQYVAENAPWGPLLMLGGGFGISKAINTSKLGEFLSKTLNASEELKEMNVQLLLALVFLLVAVLTTFASNTATAVIISPIVINLAQSKGYPPAFILLPAVVAASYAFCLPISTPPNAIVYDKAKMKQLDMFIPGLLLTIITNISLYLISVTWFTYMLGAVQYDGACNFVHSINETTLPDRTQIERIERFLDDLPQ